MSHIAFILTQARALYASSPSHCAGDDLPEDGTYCPITAITAFTCSAPVTHGTQQYAEALTALKQAAGTTRGIARWNAESTTEEVLAAFDRAIETLA